MGRPFILDENVLYRAIDGDVACLQAVHQILQRCDYLVFDHHWIRRCFVLLKRGAFRPAALELLRVVSQAWASREKMQQHLGESAAVRGEERARSNEDLWLIRLAAATGATVVTTDGRLLAHLGELGIACVEPGNV